MIRGIKRAFFKDRTVMSAAIFCLLVLGWLARTVYEHHTYITSDNVQVQGDFNTLDAQVEGNIQRVLVQEHEHVQKGQVLCVLDDRPFRVTLAQAKAEAEAAEVRYRAAKRDELRGTMLWRAGAISRQNWEHVVESARMRARQRDSLLARVDLAQQRLDKTRVLAPRDGMLAFRSAQPGMNVRAGMPLFGFVDPNARWITARFKETDLSDFKVGDPVHIQLAYGGRDLDGRIESIEHATEAPFAALIPDRAAGNFTKYVQWVPIRVAILTWPDERARLPIGITTSVRLERRRGS